MLKLTRPKDLWIGKITTAKYPIDPNPFQKFSVKKKLKKKSK